MVRMWSGFQWGLAEQQEKKDSSASTPTLKIFMSGTEKL
jgi:hypothetical protein